MTVKHIRDRLNRQRGHRLLTKAIARKLPALYSQEGKGGDAVVKVKFFSATGWKWYATEASAILPDGSTVPLRELQSIDDAADIHFFGLVVGFEPELGTFSLRELETATYEMLLGVKFPAVERDIHWTPRSLGKVARKHDTHRFLWPEDPAEAAPPDMDSLLDQVVDAYQRFNEGKSWNEFVGGRAVMEVLRQNDLADTPDERALFKQLHSALRDHKEKTPAARSSYAVFARLAGAVNATNQARNTVSSLDLFLVEAEHLERARQAYNLICQAEGLLEAIRTELPVYDEGA